MLTGILLADRRKTAARDAIVNGDMYLSLRDFPFQTLWLMDTFCQLSQDVQAKLQLK
jgi:hypothetical protein